MVALLGSTVALVGSMVVLLSPSTVALVGSMVVLLSRIGG